MAIEPKDVKWVIKEHKVMGHKFSIVSFDVMPSEVNLIQVYMGDRNISLKKDFMKLALKDW